MGGGASPPLFMCKGLIEGGCVANEENLIPFSERSEREAREIAKKGGKASGKARRKKANFRKTLDLLLCGAMDSPEVTPLLDALGVESTAEAVMLMAQVKKAAEGSTKAAYFVAQYAGQSSMTDAETRDRKAGTELKQARKQAIMGENETNEALDRLDGILKGLRENAADGEAE